MLEGSVYSAQASKACQYVLVRTYHSGINTFSGLVISLTASKSRRNHSPAKALSENIREHEQAYHLNFEETASDDA